EDFNRHFNEELFTWVSRLRNRHITERIVQIPRQATGTLNVPNHEPRLAGEIVKEIIADAP
ncbi:MAG: hypothetical protein ACLVEJ_01880, partial [Parabacteroides sp.]